MAAIKRSRGGYDQVDWESMVEIRFIHLMKGDDDDDEWHTCS